MAEFSPDVDPAFVRAALPGPPDRKVPNVTDAEIALFVANATRRVLRQVGEPQNPDQRAEVEHLITMLAKADTLERSMSEQSAAEVPLVTAWRREARELLKEYDADTVGAGESGKRTRIANVANLDPESVGLFAPSDFGLDGGSGYGADLWRR